ncbi:hypothetical protein OH76DRAFT_498071 [Lentinus brumalis]|uniref:Uncharacterized protein n=1 Tax=Lentinus brumalis TaxID=2498619 RepID=A0A371DBN5_9APHY|nr:hypothetical protein OH76DRAFT_498071 [Polyporus brumalis]
MPTLGEFIMPSPALRLPPPSASRPSWPRILVLHIYMSRPSSTLSFSPPSLPRGKRQLTPAVRRRLGTPNRSSGLRRVASVVAAETASSGARESRPHALRAAPGKAHELSSAPPHHRRQSLLPATKRQRPRTLAPTLSVVMHSMSAASVSQRHVYTCRTYLPLRTCYPRSVAGWELAAMSTAVLARPEPGRSDSEKQRQCSRTGCRELRWASYPVLLACPSHLPLLLAFETFDSVRDIQRHTGRWPSDETTIPHRSF